MPGYGCGNRAINIPGAVDIVGCMLHWQIVTWASRWGQVAEGEVYLYRAVYIRAAWVLPRLCGGRQHGGRAFGAADATVSTAGVVLDGGMRRLGHTPHTFPLIVIDGLQWKEGKGQTNCFSGWSAALRWGYP